MYQSRFNRPIAVGLVVVGLLAAAGCGTSQNNATAATTATTASSGTATTAATTSKENDKGVVITIEGSTSSLNPIVAAGLGATFTNELKQVGASWKLVGNFASESPAITALEGGSLDVANGSITATIGAWAGNAPIKLFAWGPAATTGSAILVPKGSSITSVKQLEGKTVAVNKAGSGEYTLDQALNYYNVPVSSVHKVYLQPTNTLSAFASGQVQAWGAFATFIPIAEAKLGARVLVDQGQVNGQNVTAAVVSDSFASKYPHLLKLLYNIMAEAAAKVKANPASADQYLAKNEGFDQTEITYTNEQNELWEPVTPTQVTNFQAVADLFYKDGAVPTDVSVAGKTINVNDLS